MKASSRAGLASGEAKDVREDIKVEPGTISLSADEDAAQVRKYRKLLRDEIESLGGNPRSVNQWKVQVRCTRIVMKNPSSGEVKARTRILPLYKTGHKTPKTFRSRSEAVRFLGLGDELDKAKKKKTAQTLDAGAKRKTPSKTGQKDNGSIKKMKKNNENRPKANKETLETKKEAELRAKKEAIAKSKAKAKKLSTRPLRSWQRSKIESTPVHMKPRVEEYLTEGWTAFRRVLPPRLIQVLLNGKPRQEDSNDALIGTVFGLRARKGNQRWMGAIKTINACIKQKGNTETVLSPLTTRDHGRYDMPLPDEVCDEIGSCLEASKVKEFVTGLLSKNARLRTQDIMLSRPGSTEQAAHTDSSWDFKQDLDPKTHYMTILIPLTLQDEKTGGTRVWPRSHRHSHSPDWDDYVDMIEPVIKTGDALVFDGLLTHCGMANMSKNRDRYFYYAAYATGHDFNTDVTGH